MCKVIDDVLPIVGGIVGTVVGGPLGGALGAGLGGFAGSYAQTHNFGGSLLSGGISAGASALGGELGQGLGGAGAGADSTINSNTFTGPWSQASNDVGMGMSSSDLASMSGGLDASAGSLENTMGGTGLFGMNAGTGLAGGSDLMGSMGGVVGNNAMADTSQLGITGGAYTDALGGGSGNLGQGGTTYLTTGTAATPSTGMTGGQQPQQGNQADLSQAVSQNPTNMGSGAMSSEGFQGAAQPSGGANPALMSQMNPDQQGGLSTMYGPDSIAAQSPTGSGISQSANAQMPASQVGYSSIPGTGGSMGGDGSFDWGSPQGLSTLFRLGNAGLGAYQQYQQGQAARNYANSINQMYAPDSPYAQQMQQELARKDAAAGRNSQYGSRAVQLAAALTQARSQALGNSNYANAARNTSGASMLNGLFSNFASPQAMQGLYGAGQAAYNGLSSLF